MKQFYPFVALAMMLAGAWFFFTNWEVDVSSNSPLLRPRTPSDGSLVNSPSGFNNVAPTTSPVTSTLPSSTQLNPSALQPPAVNPPYQAPAIPPAGNPAVSNATANNASANNGGNASVWNWSSSAGKMLGGNNPAAAPAANARDTIRIASFNIQVFGEKKMAQADVVNVLVNIVRNFDIVAVQEIRSQTQDILPNFVQALNQAGRRFDYVIGERLGRTSSKEQYAFIFDTDTVEVDRRSLYTVADPDDLLHREPLVAWFRCRRADPREAFTFSLVNVHVDPDSVNVSDSMSEINVLDDVFRAVRDDSRGEDDVILLGDLNANDQHLGHLGRMPNIAWVINNTPTNTRRDAQYDNLIFDQLATREYLGRGGVFDFLREYNLSQAQALKVSDHLPVWAEFSVVEGGVPGRVARQSAYHAPPSYEISRGYNTAPVLEGYYDARQYGQQQYADPRAYPATPNVSPGYAGQNYGQPSYAGQSPYAGQPTYSARQPSYDTRQYQQAPYQQARRPAAYDPRYAPAAPNYNPTPNYGSHSGTSW